ncbi:hypothetical protein AB0K60_04775 [Thermopolyspora sp. NPDC052614]|uniref:hypothetical protein n=1 Tax=Thermopolyspora sp. NPDC052614 TaxID=3155682 RepID=UPI00341E63B5
MNTSTDDRRRAPYLVREPHVHAGYDGLIRYCGASLSAPHGPQYIAHYGTGVFDFSVDTFDHDECATLLRMPPKETRDRYRHAARQFIVCVEDFDLSLRALNTGEVIRTVVQSVGSGALYCGRIRSGEYVVGAALPPLRAEAMDLRMNHLANEIRENEFRLGSEHPGGDIPPSPADPGDVNPPSAPRTWSDSGLREQLQTRLFNDWAYSVGPDDLHYAALYRNWSPVHVGDVFDDPQLGRWFTDIAITSRRTLYQDIASRLRSDMSRLRHALRLIIDGPIDRLVLDVQAGALYVHWLQPGSGDFLVGVTLMQDKVWYAEARLRRLVERVRHTLSHVE